jgi:alkylation response protein AidB-like acyl-CoA dehydrogenase
MSDTIDWSSRDLATHRDNVRGVLASPEGDGLVGPAREGDTAALRNCYALLGAHGLLTPDWPTEYGGGGLSTAHAIVTYEELASAGIADIPYVVTVQIIGNFLLKAGSGDLKHDLLPAISRGETFASVLYSEPSCGSDLGALTTSAERCDGGYRLRGSKMWSLYTDTADIAIIAARTSSHESSRYLGISLFVIDLRSDGIRLTELPTVQDEQFFRTDLDDVFVPASRLVGQEGDGWPLLDGALAIERTGLDHASRARRWLDALVRPGIDPMDPRSDQLSRLTMRVLESTYLARQAAGRFLDGDVRAVDMALTKLVTSHTAQDVAAACSDWIGPGLGPCGARPEDVEVMNSATREGPGLTLSAGTSEVMLSMVAAELMSDPGKSLGVVEKSQHPPTFQAAHAVIAAAVSTHKPPPLDIALDVARFATVWKALTESELTFLEAPVDLGGFSLEIAYGLALCEALGHAGIDDCYGPAALLMDAVALYPWLGDPVADVLKGVPVTWALGEADEGGPGPGKTVLQVATVSGRSVAVRAPVRDSVDRGERSDEAGVRRPDRNAVSDGVQLMAGARLRQAAYVLGLSMACLEEASVYARDRRQFGKSLLEHQAVAFPLGSLIGEWAGFRELLRSRATTSAADADPVFAARALARACELGRLTARQSVQASGARGLTGASRCSSLHVRLRDEGARLGSPAELWRLANTLDHGQQLPGLGRT